MALYDYQRIVYDLIVSGHSVILQAPTGAGKTRAALYPFLRAWEEQGDFPRKCIYSVPMRVLANQFWEEYSQRAQNFGFVRPLDVTIQTGARSEDAKLEGNLIFSTIDQTLSNFLNIPYALGLGQGNLNAGAVLSSYLVFDEFHLFDPETTLPTTLHLLRLLQGVTPFLVMTATFSTDRIEALAKELGAEPIVLSAEEAGAIPSQRKTRRISTTAGLLTADQVIGRHQHRSIAICNTVERVQKLYEDLCEKAGTKTEVRLLHNRFLRKDRDQHEAWLQREFGKDRSKHTVESAILVATQVAEVGLDISSEALHTELAPAASVIQRAGRCARYEGEEGDVFVYPLPVNEAGQSRYAPYHEGGQAAICELTWAALTARSGQIYDFDTELKVVDEAHGEADRLLTEKLRANRHYIADRIAATISAQERGAASELIRSVDSRTVIVHPEPSTIANPWSLEGLGIFRGSLIGSYDAVDALAIENGIEWCFMTADPIPEEAENTRAKIIWKWRHIQDKNDLAGALLVAVNPALASYSPSVGFQLAVLGNPGWQSPEAERRKMQQKFPPYRRETIIEHVARMLRVYRHPFYDPATRKQRLALGEELTYAAQRLEERYGWPSGLVDRLVRLVVIAHDLGKLDVRWQNWAHRWQRELSGVRGTDLSISDLYLAAHTDYDQDNPAEKNLNQKLSKLRPNHASESAAMAMKWLLKQTGNPGLARAALTAIITHHNAGSTGKHEAVEIYAGSSQAFEQMLSEADLSEVGQDGLMWKLPAGEELINRRIDPKNDDQLLAYLLLVRALRLADQRSQSW